MKEVRIRSQGIDVEGVLTRWRGALQMKSAPRIEEGLEKYGGKSETERS